MEIKKRTTIFNLFWLETYRFFSNIFKLLILVEIEPSEITQNFRGQGLWVFFYRFLYYSCPEKPTDRRSNSSCGFSAEIEVSLLIHQF
jgi:hypothetical protein